MENRAWLWPSILTFLVITCLLSIVTGPLQIAPLTSFNAVLNWATHLELGAVAPHEQLVINNVRLPRTLLAMTVGATLAQCGAVMQGCFPQPFGRSRDHRRFIWRCSWGRYLYRAFPWKW